MDVMKLLSLTGVVVEGALSSCVLTCRLFLELQAENSFFPLMSYVNLGPHLVLGQ